VPSTYGRLDGVDPLSPIVFHRSWLLTSELLRFDM
jgi:hypothetical protein